MTSFSRCIYITLKKWNKHVIYIFMNSNLLHGCQTIVYGTIMLTDHIYCSILLERTDKIYTKHDLLQSMQLHFFRTSIIIWCPSLCYE